VLADAEALWPEAEARFLSQAESQERVQIAKALGGIYHPTAHGFTRLNLFAGSLTWSRRWAYDYVRTRL